MSNARSYYVPRAGGQLSYRGETSRQELGPWKLQPWPETQPKAEREGEKYLDFSLLPTLHFAASDSYWLKLIKCLSAKRSGNCSSWGSVSYQSRARKTGNLSEGKKAGDWPRESLQSSCLFWIPADSLEMPGPSIWWTVEEEKYIAWGWEQSLGKILIAEIFHSLS